MSYIVYNPTTRLSVGAYQKLSDANAVAAADANLAADTTDITLPDAYQPRAWYFTTGGVLVPDAPDNNATLLGRRAAHKQLLRGLEQIPGLAAWASQDDTDTNDLLGRESGPMRAKYYARWVEMQARYGSVDANILSATNWPILLAEASIPGRFWYVHFVLDLPEGDDRWTMWLRNDNRSWVFYRTTGPDGMITGATATTPNSYTGVAAPMTPAADGFNWINYLGD